MKIIKTLLFKYTEVNGKYIGCQVWSEGALKSFKKHNSVVTSSRIFGDEALLHEHVYPRNELAKILLDTNDETEIKNILSEKNKSVIVTRGEDSRLSKKGNFDNIFQRYSDARITRIAVTWKGNKIVLEEILKN